MGGSPTNLWVVVRGHLEHSLHYPKYITNRDNEYDVAILTMGESNSNFPSIRHHMGTLGKMA
jgi:hypothetical protein